LTLVTQDCWEQAAAAAARAYRTVNGSHAGRLAAALEAHLAALAAAGVLTKIPPGMAAAPTTEDDARSLALASGHPRHGGEEGWQRLLTSESDIRMAFRQATEDLGARQGAARDALTARRDRLLAALANQPGHSDNDQV